MELLNLDKFSNKKEFMSGGNKHTIRGMKVKELHPFTEALKGAKTDDDKIDVMVDMLSKITSMTMDELNNLEVGELTALITVSQGGDPSVDDEGK